MARLDYIIWTWLDWVPGDSEPSGHVTTSNMQSNLWNAVFILLIVLALASFACYPSYTFSCPTWFFIFANSGLTTLQVFWVSELHLSTSWKEKRGQPSREHKQKHSLGWAVTANKEHTSSKIITRGRTITNISLLISWLIHSFIDLPTLMDLDTILYSSLFYSKVLWKDTVNNLIKKIFSDTLLPCASTCYSGQCLEDDIWHMKHSCQFLSKNRFLACTLSSTSQIPC